MADVVVAERSSVVVLDGTRHRVRRGRTTADPDARIVREHPHLWCPLQVDFPAPAKPKATRSKTAKKAKAED